MRDIETAGIGPRHEELPRIARRYIRPACHPSRGRVGGAGAPPLRIVGVAESSRDVLLTGVPPAKYLPFAQRPVGNLGLVVRARGSAPLPPGTRERLVAEADPRVDATSSRTLLDRLRAELQPQRTASAWVGVFDAIALLLAAMGLYGVVAQSVLQRTRELAVRSALGASPASILLTVLGDGARLATLGVVVGGFGALAMLRVLQSLFTGVVAANMGAAAVAAIALGTAMLAVTYLPARRAARLNPVDALRSD